MLAIDEILALDLLTMRDHTEAAGDTFDPAAHRIAVARMLAETDAIVVRKHGDLIAYATLKPQEDGCWFVTGFNTHPAHRTAATFRALFDQLFSHAQRYGITAFRSHVYKTNRLSMAFHQRLGFRVTRENAKAIEFHASLAALSANAAFNRPRQRT